MSNPDLDWLSRFWFDNKKHIRVTKHFNRKEAWPLRNLPIIKRAFIWLRQRVEGISLMMVLFFMAWGCASTGYPTGGPKDERPPVVVRSTPEANALNFKDDEILIVFDEIIQVKDIFQKLVVSPPVNTRPVVSARGKELLIRFEEDLQPNTTYTLDFADAISDNNEGNVLQDFRFSFSTGEVVDSMSVSGFLFDATNLEPVAGALVMVHSNQADSAFRKQVPIRLAKTSQDGRFSVQNLAPGLYRLYALEDANRNYLYDQPGERIGWHSHLIEPSTAIKQRVDSLPPDTFQIVDYMAFIPDSLQMFIFQEDNAVQYLKENKRDARNKIDLQMNRPLNDSLDIRLLANPELNDWFIYERNVGHDSISVWLTDSLEIKSDSLFLTVGYETLDTLGQPVFQTDTLNAFFFQKGGGETRSRRREQPKELPALKPSAMKTSLETLQELDIVFPTPVLDYDLNAVKLYQVIDTIQEPIEFTFVRDPLRLRRFVVDYPWEPGQKYELEADSAAFRDIYGLASSAISHSFSVKPIDSYGVIFVDVANPRANWLIQILNKQENPVRQMSVPANGKIGFQYLRPGDYFLRIIEDTNGNGRWDTGNFELGIQPEKLLYFPESVNIRANWDRLIPWDPAAFDIHDFVKRNRQKSRSNR